MNTPDDILNAAASSGRKSVIIFTGQNCPWCDKLHGHLDDNVFQEFCGSNNIDFNWFSMGSKAEEELSSCEGGACKVPTRNRFGITTVPTAIFFGVDGAIIAKTEYLDPVDTLGGNAYVEWLQKALALSVRDDEL